MLQQVVLPSTHDGADSVTLRVGPPLSTRHSDFFVHGSLFAPRIRTTGQEGRDRGCREEEADAARLEKGSAHHARMMTRG